METGVLATDFDARLNKSVCLLAPAFPELLQGMLEMAQALFQLESETANITWAPAVSQAVCGTPLSLFCNT